MHPDETGPERVRPAPDGPAPAPVEPVQRRPEKNRSLLGHKTNRIFYILLQMLIIVCIAILIMHFLVVNQLKEERRQLEEELERTSAELERYTEAYQIVLEDAQAFGEIYGLEYEGRVEAEPAEKASTAAPERPLVAKELEGAGTWGSYLAGGIISDACIPTTKAIQSSEDELEIVLIATGEAGEELPALSLLIDGVYIASYRITAEEGGVYKALVVLPKGTHYLDLAFTNGDRAESVRVEALRIGDRTLETGTSIIDYGTAFAMFDCRESEVGEVLEATGAMRFRIERI